MIKTKTIKLKDIVIDAGTQQRVTPTDSVIDEYAESIKCGAKFPPVTVFSNGVEYYLVDGFHRYFAHKKVDGITEIEAEIHEGTKRDAILHSASVNGTHGLRLTNQDKRKHVLVLLNDEEWSQWSNRDIAKHCNVGHSFVDKLRKEVNGELPTVGKTSSKPAPILESKNEETAEQTENHEEFDEKSIREEMADEFDPAAEIEKAHKEIDQLTSIIESDDKLAAATAEIKRLNALIEVIESQKRAFQSSENAAKQAAKMWKAKFEKLERQMKASGLVEF